MAAAKTKSTKRSASKRPQTPTAPVRFIESMECLGVTKLPEGPEWTYEIKLDGYRLEAVKSSKEVTLYSRRGNVLNDKFRTIAAELSTLPPGTILDGEVVALDEKNRSDFNLLQNFRSAESRIHYYAFDILLLKGRSLLAQPLKARRQLLAKVLPHSDHLGLAAVDPNLSHLMTFVTAHGLEGVVAKRADSAYEPGKRSGLWVKHRINQGQEFVIGGYTPGSLGFDAIIVGFYRGKELMFAARVRAGFVPGSRRSVFAKIKDLKMRQCPFANLPEASAGRFGQGLTAEKMKECVWVKPLVVARIDFAEWTGADKLRHTAFVALREDKDPKRVVKEEN